MNFMPPIIVWFRNDLRVIDHGALFHASATNRPIIPIYILDDNGRKLGGASKYWLHHSLKAHKDELAKLGLKLVLRKGDAVEILKNIINETGANSIYCQRAYEAFAIKQELELHEFLGENFRRFSGNLLIEPEKIKNLSGNSFQIFTPFFKNLVASGQVRSPLGLPSKPMANLNEIKSEKLDDWELLPTNPNWAKGFANWNAGENGAWIALDDFLKSKLSGYGENRDRPDLNATSLLAPHLRFGEISPASIWQRVHFHCGGELSKDGYKFLSELGWREFSYHILFTNPDIATRPHKVNFENFPWHEDEKGLKAWQKGQTGYPIVDAGMRELWHTGYMHNRVRMIVASFLIKDMLVPWQRGEEWFWDCLLDADPANNPCSWQWVAGCGYDAAPYYRIFNPTIQAQKFDPKGKYIRKWVPEIAKLPDAYIHAPHLAPIEFLRNSGIALGKTYPLPIVDHKMARERALDALKAI